MKKNIDSPFFLYFIKQNIKMFLHYNQRCMKEQCSKNTARFSPAVRVANSDRIKESEAELKPLAKTLPLLFNPVI